MERVSARARMIAEQQSEHVEVIVYDMYDFMRKRVNAEDVCANCAGFMEFAVRLYKSVTSDKSIHWKDQFASKLERLKDAKRAALLALKHIPATSHDHARLKARIASIERTRKSVLTELKAYELQDREMD